MRSWLTPEEVDAFEHDPDVLGEQMAIQVAEETVRLMKQFGVSRAELASLMGVSRSYVSRLLNAPPNMTLRSIAQIAIVLGTRPHVSLYGEDGSP